MSQIRARVCVSSLCIRLSFQEVHIQGVPEYSETSPKAIWMLKERGKSSETLLALSIYDVGVQEPSN